MNKRNTMKVKDLIQELKKHDPEKEVLIQQGEEFDYMTAYTVKSRTLAYMNSLDEDAIDAVVIEYN